MDRFPESKGKDSQDEQAYYICDESDKEIYQGEFYLETRTGLVLVDDMTVLMEHFEVVRKIAGEDVV